MHYDICILAPRDAFSRMLFLECEDSGKRTVLVSDPATLPDATLYIIDADRFAVIPPHAGVLRYGRQLSPRSLPAEDGSAALTEWRRPFLLTELRRFLSSDGAPRGLFLLAEESAVLFDGCRIPLSSREYALLACLYEANGTPVSREEIYATVWGEGEVREDLVNVYLHYLRKKLERSGRRPIVAVRGRGYALKREEEGL